MDSQEPMMVDRNMWCSQLRNAKTAKEVDLLLMQLDKPEEEIYDILSDSIEMSMIGSCTASIDEKRANEKEVAKVLLTRAAKADVYKLGPAFDFAIVKKQFELIEVILSALWLQQEGYTQSIRRVVDALYWALEYNNKNCQKLSLDILKKHPNASDLEILVHAKAIGGLDFIAKMNEALHSQ